MRTATAKRLQKILADAAKKPEKGEKIEAYALKSFKKFEKDLLNLIKAGDVLPELISMVGVSIEAQYKSSRNTTIRIGMLNLMIELGEYCYKDDTDKEILARVKEQIDKWRDEKKQAEGNLKKLETLTPDDILNAPPIKKD